MNQRARGLTLVEILAALAVMAIGISAVTLMMLTGTRLNRSSLERNAATMMINEAVPEIERRHLITQRMKRNSMPDLIVGDPAPANAILPEELGLLIETLDSTPNPNIHESRYTSAMISATTSHGDALLLKCFDTLPADTIHMSMWPMPPELPKTYGSLLELRNGDRSPHGTPLRMLYRLERHPDWDPHTIDATGNASYLGERPNSPYRGVYVLTMTIYKDSKRDGSTLEQVTDPYVVYLNDKKVRQ